MIGKAKLFFYSFGILATGFLWVNSQLLYSATQPYKQTPSAISSLLPTLTAGQTAFERLMQDNGGCELPCWWGFTFGKTRQDEWLRFLDKQPFKIFRVDPLSNGTLVPIDYGYFSFPQSTSSSKLHYDFKDGMLSKVNIQINNPNKWLSKNVTAILLSGLLTRLKNQHQIPKIYIFVGGTSTLNLPFLVVADDIGVMAQYTFNIYDILSVPNDPNQWHYCLGLDQTIQIEITVQDPNVKPIVSTKERRLIEAMQPPQWVRLEDWITPINTDDFIQFFVNNPNNCYVPSNLTPEATNAS